MYVKKAVTTSIELFIVAYWKAEHKAEKNKSIRLVWSCCFSFNEYVPCKDFKQNYGEQNEDKTLAVTLTKKSKRV